jgi:hypothetical protein
VHYVYDDEHRLITRRSSPTNIIYYYYAIPDRPHLVTHMTIGDVVTMFYYTDDDRLFAMEQSGQHYAIVVDADRTVTHLFGEDGTLVKEMLRNPIGQLIIDTNPSFYVPIGWRGHIDDTMTGVVFIGGRPLDTSTGRFMSVDPDTALRSPDPYYPEQGCDLFSFDANSGRPIMPTG